jgi:hypothetical protein
MDYCSSCRRKLNGALVCPGCGAYAPDIDPAGPMAKATAAKRAARGTAPRSTVTDTAPASPDGPTAYDDGELLATAGYAARLGLIGEDDEADDRAGDAESAARPLRAWEVPAGAAEEDGGREAAADAGGDGVPDAGRTGDGTSAADVKDRTAELAAEEEAGDAAAPAGLDGTGDEEPDIPELHRGRAGRRLQLARWSSNRRRAVAGAALALIGGGITLGAVAAGLAKAPRTASAPDATTLAPSPSGSTGHAAPAAPGHGGPSEPQRGTAGTLSPSADSGLGPTRILPGAPPSTWRTATGVIEDLTQTSPTHPPARPSPTTPSPSSPTGTPTQKHLCVLSICLH